MNFDLLIAEALRKSDDPDVVTDELLKLPAEVLFPLLRPAIRRWVADHQRHHTRAVEELVDAKLDEASDLPSRAAARRRLVGESFALPDGTRVDWLHATAEQHREAAEWARGQAETLTRYAIRHETAAADIDAAGVACLADLEAVLV